MAKFRKKPVVIEAEQWSKDGDHSRVHKWQCDNNTQPQNVTQMYESKCKHCGNKMRLHGEVETLEGHHIVCPGDWIIKGIKGEFYPCKPDIFSKTYDPIGG